MTAIFPKPEAPKSLLGYHRILSPTAGVRVSPLCLGAMNFGEAWKGQLGECTKENSFAMLDYFWENGGNFIDTANNYQGEESEAWLGEWFEKNNNRDEFVIATKFTTGFRPKTSPEKMKSNFQGNHSKSLKISLEHSLRKLRTTYVDLLYVHWWDFSTSIPELMNSLHALVASGKILYLGISDTPAWLVVKCNDYARFHGLTQFSVYQGHWSAAFRDFERDIIPMCRAEGMALAPWGAVGRGQFKPKEEYDDPNREGRKTVGERSEAYVKVSNKLEELAKKKNTLITSIAIAYVMHKAPYVFPIVGGRKIEHLKGNIEALGVKLTQDEIDEIEDTQPFDVGFPQSFLFSGQTWRSRYNTGDIFFVKANAPIDAHPEQQPIAPGSGEEKLLASLNS